ncbi:MAG: recombination mediator RecR [Flavobacteriales bacterium]|nr:recombination protein RecR [Flavobacteriales bacterium]MCZ2442664.1 recombination mediator RecR [Flavobacteriales bacterium]
MDELRSHALAKAVDAFASLPGIGRKTAMRMVLHLLKQDENDVTNFGEALIRLKQDVRFCKTCHNLAEADYCHICANPNRQHQIICVVEDIRDVIAIENTGEHKGAYHVLGGRISPIDGTGPADLHIDSLIERISQNKVDELILALSCTLEGDTTNFYLFKKISAFSIPITTIARGIGVGDELEYADELTLARSIVHRLPYEKTLAG